MKLAPLILLIYGCASTPKPLPPIPGYAPDVRFVFCMLGPVHDRWAEHVCIRKPFGRENEGICTWVMGAGGVEMTACGMFDLNGDGKVDLKDYAIRQRRLR